MAPNDRAQRRLERQRGAGTRALADTANFGFSIAPRKKTPTPTPRRVTKRLSVRKSKTPRRSVADVVEGTKKTPATAASTSRAEDGEGMTIVGTAKGKGKKTPATTRKTPAAKSSEENRAALTTAKSARTKTKTPTTRKSKATPRTEPPVESMPQSSPGLFVTPAAAAGKRKRGSQQEIDTRTPHAIIERDELEQDDAEHDVSTQKRRRFRTSTNSLVRDATVASAVRTRDSTMLETERQDEVVDELDADYENDIATHSVSRDGRRSSGAALRPTPHAAPRMSAGPADISMTDASQFITQSLHQGLTPTTSRSTRRVLHPTQGKASEAAVSANAKTPATKKTTSLSAPSPTPPNTAQVEMKYQMRSHWKPVARQSLQRAASPDELSPAPEDASLRKAAEQNKRRATKNAKAKPKAKTGGVQKRRASRRDTGGTSAPANDDADAVRGSDDELSFMTEAGEATQTTQPPTRPSSASQPTTRAATNVRGAIPITVYRPQRLGARDDEEDIEGEADGDELQDTSLWKRSGVNGIDVLAQVSSEVIAQMAERCKTQRNSERNVVRRAALKRRRAALLDYAKELNVSLFTLTEALDAHLLLTARAKEAVKTKIALREELMEVRRQRREIAVRTDTVRATHRAQVDDHAKLGEVDAMMADVELAVSKGSSVYRAAEREGGSWLPRLDLAAKLKETTRMVGTGTANGGILDRVKSVNKFLEETARRLERRV